MDDRDFKRHLEKVVTEACYRGLTEITGQFNYPYEQKVIPFTVTIKLGIEKLQAD